MFLRLVNVNSNMVGKLFLLFRLNAFSTDIYVALDLSRNYVCRIDPSYQIYCDFSGPAEQVRLMINYPAKEYCH